MKNLSILTAVAFNTMIASTGSRAQQGPEWSPLEILGCNYVNDSDMDDLNRVVATWDEWMDGNGVGGYTAILLTPMYVSASLPYEVLWLGAFDDGAALGGMQQWLADGGEVQDDFAQVMDCPSRQAMAINNLKELGEPTGIVPVEFTNCTLREGRTGAEARAALLELIDFYADNGSDAGHWVLLPGPGEDPEAGYSFKWVTAYTSYAALGREFETLMNGGGMQRTAQTVERIMSCDFSRMYNSRVIRESGAD